MTVDAADRADGLARRLERFRAATRTLTAAPGPEGLEAGRVLGSAVLAERLAVALDGEVVRTGEGIVVRCEAATRPLPVDRDRLATLPGQPAPAVPLVCLDTETTGLATAAGTVAFLIGLGWWEGDRFRQVQLLLPDHGEEAALLTALADMIPADGWLVTYNGRGFDWPLLVTRYRMQRRSSPPHAGHLDLLPLSRRLFRHRLGDARLKSVEAGVLGIERHGDVEGWEIPRRYLGFLRGGPVTPLVDVVRHNDQDVRSLARLLAHLDQGYAGVAERRSAPAGDLAGLARAFARHGCLEEALGCYDDALVAPPPPPRTVERAVPVASATSTTAPWWSPTVPADFGGRPTASWRRDRPEQVAAFATPWTTERIAVERAHLLRRLGRWEDAAAAWSILAAGPGRVAIVASVELAKLHEHRRHDVRAALEVVIAGLSLADRRRQLGRPEPRLEADLARRVVRLRRRTFLSRHAATRATAASSARVTTSERPQGAASRRSARRPSARSPA